MAEVEAKSEEKPAPTRELTVVEKRIATIRQLLDRSKAQIAQAAGKTLDADRQLRLAMTMIQKNPTLGECTPLSIVGAVMQASQLRLELDGVLGHAYLVPFRNRGQYEAQFICGYRGYIVLMHRSNRVAGIQVEVVYEGDKFKYQYGTAQGLHHQPALTNRGEKIAAYAVVHYRGGGHEFLVLSREQIEAIRARSPAYRNAEDRGGKSPWHTDEDAMWKKTAIRQIAKTTPLSTDAQRAAIMEDYHEAGITVDVDLEPASAAVPTETKVKVLTEKVRASGKKEEKKDPPAETDEDRIRREWDEAAAAGTAARAAQGSLLGDREPGSD